MKRLNPGHLFLAAVFAAGCSASDSGDTDGAVTQGEVDAGAVSEGPTWHQDIKPLVDQHCNGCHQAGGVGPFALDTYDAVKTHAPVAMAAIDAERMPPWQPSHECREIAEVRHMPIANREVFAAWIDDGMPEGTPNAEAAQVAEVPTPDLTGRSSVAYTPNAERPDDYRCFILDMDFDADTYVVGTNVEPDKTPIVHHALVYVIQPGEVAEMEAKAEREEGPGYTCYGGPGTSGVPSPLAAWVPGMPPQFTTDDSMFFIPKGSKLVMQMHYNVLSAAPEPDRTALHLYTSDSPRSHVLETLPQVQFDMDIPAGEPEVVITKTFTHRQNEPGVIVGMAPHMHILGTRIKVEVERENGEVECGIDIPEWDFNWQQTYRFKEPLVVNKGDSFKLTCVYDNSVANQAVVNGEQLPPQDVHWGEGTLDEMCLNFVTYKRVFVPEAAGQCGGFEACRAGCEDPNNFECVMGCGAQDMDCGLCMIFDMIGQGGCAREPCLPQLAGAQGCLQSCLTEIASGGSDLIACMAATCPDQLNTVDECMTPIIAAGTCEASINACLPEE